MNFVDEKNGDQQIYNAIKNEGKDSFLPRSHPPGGNHAKLLEDQYIESRQNKRDSKNKRNKREEMFRADKQHGRHPAAQQQHQIGGQQ